MGETERDRLVLLLLCLNLWVEDVRVCACALGPLCVWCCWRVENNRKEDQKEAMLKNKRRGGRSVIGRGEWDVSERWEWCNSKWTKVINIPWISRYQNIWQHLTLSGAEWDNPAVSCSHTVARFFLWIICKYLLYIFLGGAYYTVRNMQ